MSPESKGLQMSFKPRQAIRLALLSLALPGFSTAVQAQAHLYVTSGSGKINQYQGPGGANPGAFEKQLNTPADAVNPGSSYGIAIGADGNVYVSSYDTSEILRYSGATGNFTDVFISGSQLSNPIGATFGPDGNFYVTNRGTHSISRYKPDGAKFGAGGNLADATFIPSAAGDGRGIAFDAIGDLYVADTTAGILRYKGTDGTKFGAGGNTSNAAFTSSFFANGLTFGSDGTLYAASIFTNEVRKFDASGTQIGSFTAGGDPLDVKFDESGILYVDNQSLGVKKFTTSGVALGPFGSAGTSPIGNSYFMVFSSSPAVSSTTPEPGSIALLISSGLTGAAFLRRKRKAC
jgi:hypothetical protein